MHPWHFSQELCFFGFIGNIFFIFLTILRINRLIALLPSIAKRRIWTEEATNLKRSKLAFCSAIIMELVDRRWRVTTWYRNIKADGTRSISISADCGEFRTFSYKFCNRVMNNLMNISDFLFSWNQFQVFVLRQGGFVEIPIEAI